VESEGIEEAVRDGGVGCGPKFEFEKPTDKHTLSLYLAFCGIV